jgi:hypothetical protein
MSGAFDALGSLRGKPSSVLRHNCRDERAENIPIGHLSGLLIDGGKHFYDFEYSLPR